MTTDSRTARIAALLTQLAELMSDEMPMEHPEAKPIPDRILFTVEEAAEQLHIGRTRMFALVKSGEIDSVMIGRLRRIHIDSIHDYARRLFTNQAA